MTDKNAALIVAIVDESGSMGLIKEDTEGGFNTFISEQAKGEGTATVTLTRFNTRSAIEYAHKPISDVKPLQLRPSGGTALVDAIGKSITETGNYLRSLTEEERPGSVIVVILTDGQENSSREYTKAQINQMIKHQSEKYGWVFVFLGANQDAIAEARSYGIPMGTSLTYTGQNVGQAFASTSTNLNSYRSAVVAGASVGSATMDSYSYSDDQREEAVEEEKETTTV